MLGPLTFKLRTFLAKQVSQDFMHSFLGLINPTGNHQFWHRAAPCLRHRFMPESDRREQGNQEIRRIFTDRMRTQTMIKPRGEGLLSLLHNPLNPSLMAPLQPCLSGCSFLEESYPSLTIQPSRGQAGRSKGGRGCAPARRISYVSLVA